MEKSTLMLIGVLAVMVLLAGVQFFQFNSLTSNLSKVKVNGAVAASSSSTPVSSGNGNGNTPNALASLPSQVGGC